MQQVTKQGTAKRRKGTNKEHTGPLTVILAGHKSGVLQHRSSNLTFNIKIITILAL